MENDTVQVLIVERRMIEQVVSTLKEIDVRGFDSMDRLVGCVITLENALNTKYEPASSEEEKDLEE